MYFNGEEVYPETISENIIISINPMGYEDAEQILFSVNDSIVSLPGFKSDRMLLKFIILKDTLQFKFVENEIYNSEELNTTKNIFLEKFQIILFPRKEMLELKSKTTSIRLINKNYLMQKRIDDIFSNLNR